MNYTEENTEVYNELFGLHVGKYQCHLPVYISGKIFPPWSFPEEYLKSNFEKSYPRNSLLIFKKTWNTRGIPERVVS